MRTYPNNDKAAIIARMRAHIEADRLVKGQYWENGKGCAVGCLTHSSDHRSVADMLGIDIRLAHLYDAIFEGLPNGESRDWSIQFLEAIPEGKEIDTEMVWYLFASRLLMRVKARIGEGDEDWRKSCHEAVRRVAELCDKAGRGEVVQREEWTAAEDAAWDAAENARTAAWAARAAAWTAEDAAWDAAESARTAARTAAWTAEDAEYRAQRDDLIELLKS